MTLLIGFFLSAILTAIPPAIAILILWRLDHYEKEPLWLALGLFLWGALPSAILSIISQIALDIPISLVLSSATAQTFGGIVIAPLTEETIKGLILFAAFAFYRHEFDGVLDGILYGALVGFGFSFVEDILYLMGALGDKGWEGWGILLLIRVGLFSMNHSLFTACTGAGLGLARVSKETWKKISLPLAGWLLAMTLHGIHNTGAALAQATYGLLCIGATLIDWMGVGLILIVIVFALQAERRWLKQLEPEVTAGFLTPDEYAWASDLNLRSARGWKVLSRHGIGAWFAWSRYVQLLVDLAFKKNQLANAGDGADTARRIANLRERITQARDKLPTI
jgi:protease PrsW